MNVFKKICAAAMSAVLSLSLCGCVMTVDQMYVPPRRSESYKNLQSLMDEYRRELDYCAPITGENQQTVQMADLTGDGIVKVFFADTRKMRGARAAFDSRMVAELRRVLGDEKVVLK